METFGIKSNLRTPSILHRKLYRRKFLSNSKINIRFHIKMKKKSLSDTFNFPVQHLTLKYL